MANLERSRIKEYAFRGAEVIVVGLALLTAIGAGISFAEGDLVLAKKAVISTAVYALIAGGIIYAEKHFASKNNPNPPRS